VRLCIPCDAARTALQRRDTHRTWEPAVKQHYSLNKTSDASTPPTGLRNSYRASRAEQRTARYKSQHAKVIATYHLVQTMCDIHHTTLKRNELLLDLYTPAPAQSNQRVIRNHQPQRPTSNPKSKPIQRETLGVPPCVLTTKLNANGTRANKESS